MARAYYNEIDRDAVHVLRCLIADGLIAPGDVDDRSIKDVQPDDLDGYTQAHFFAGAGLWSVAARLAGWPDARPLWTGSCPCQPFSAAGRGLGTDDPRHLWPDFFRLIRAHRPPVVLGEQVAGAPGYGWFDGVRSDLEGEDFASRVVDIPACSVDAPHIRQRLYWCAVEHGSGDGREQGFAGAEAARHGRELAATDQRLNGPVADSADNRGPEVRSCDVAIGQQWSSIGRRTVEPARARANDRGVAGHLRQADGEGVAHADGATVECGRRELPDPQGQERGRGSDGHRRDADFAGRNGSAWAGADWIICHDGKARRTEPGLRLLVDGMAGRVPAWRLAGNSISPVLAAEVISAFLETEHLTEPHP